MKTSDYHSLIKNQMANEELLMAKLSLSGLLIGFLLTLIILIF